MRSWRSNWAVTKMNGQLHVNSCDLTWLFNLSILRKGFLNTGNERGSGAEWPPSANVWR